jgi:uncharacterized Zn finger protein
MTTIPTLTEQSIRAFVGEQNFQKGQQHVERLIAGRGRANYQVACSYLVKVRSLYEKLDETGQWTTYITWLRKQHSRLSTLKEELTTAGL